MPAKADPAVQQHFLDSTLQPLLNEAVAEKQRVFFVDAAHFVRGTLRGYLWCFDRWVVPTKVGRQRYSVLGALDAATRLLICETADATVTEVTVGRLLLKIRDAHPEGPISIVWDNARYQHTAIVRSIAAYARIDLAYLPAYSPNLNLIERVWKFVKKEAWPTKPSPTSANSERPSTPRSINWGRLTRIKWSRCSRTDSKRLEPPQS